MKVYALREMSTTYGYMPVRGYHTSLVAAKKQAKKLFNRTAEWDIAAYEVQTKFLKDDIVDLLNGDSISSEFDGKLIRDFMSFIDIAFESAAMKRYRKEWRSV